MFCIFNNILNKFNRICFNSLLKFNFIFKWILFREKSIRCSTASYIIIPVLIITPCLCEAEVFASDTQLKPSCKLIMNEKVFFNNIRSDIFTTFSSCPIPFNDFKSLLCFNKRITQSISRVVENFILSFSVGNSYSTNICTNTSDDSPYNRPYEPAQESSLNFCHWLLILSFIVVVAGIMSFIILLFLLTTLSFKFIQHYDGL